MAINRIAYGPGQPYTVPWHGPVRVEKAFGGTIAITAVDVTTINNTVQLFTVPKGFTITDFRLDVTSLAASALTLSVGDATLATRLLNASTIGVAGGLVSVLPATVLGFKYPADTDIQLLVSAAAVTPAAGTLILFLKGFIDA